MDISKFQKMFGIAPVGFIIGLVLFCLLWLLDRRLGHVEILSQPGPVRIFGIILIGVWICWHTWCLKTIVLWWREDRLCTTGPYRFVRHPIYAGGILFFCLGISLMFNSWIILLFPILLYPIYSILVRKEEMMMTAVFGEEYKRYAAHTGRLFPRFFPY